MDFCTPWPSTRPLPRLAAIYSDSNVTVRKTNERGVSQGDYVERVADYRVEYYSMAGAWSSYDVCNAPMRLRVPRIHLTPSHHDGVALLQGGPPGCEFTRVVLISRRKVPSRLPRRLTDSAAS